VAVTGDLDRRFPVVDDAAELTRGGAAAAE
jgi:hypothetical protein